MNPTFSIILPTYNNLSLCKRAAESVLQQTYKVWELIIVDDSPSDDIEQYIVKLGDKRIAYHHNKKSLGAIRNWNYGVSLANGDYVIVLHHDEAFSDAGYLLAVEQSMRMDFDVVIAPVKVMDHKHVYQITSPQRFGSLFLKQPSLLFLVNQIGPCACVTIRRKNIEPFNEQLQWLVDVEWYYRMLHHKKVHALNIKNALTSLHNHQGQITQNINIHKTLCKDINIIKGIYRNKISIRIFLFINRTINKQNRLRKLLRSFLRKHEDC